MHFHSILLCLALFLLLSSPLLAWAESGHAIIMMLARERLTPQEQEKLQTLIEQHPNYAKDFTPPVDFPVGIETEKWKIGRIGYWPDIARAYDEYNRPTWHYQLGAALTMGDVTGIDIPKDPGPLPENATMSTQELYVLQALELCTKQLADKSIPAADRAVALCWVAHLIADLHLPCHSGSLYAESIFTEPDGDRGANRIVIGELRLHGLWDQLLGNIYDRADVNRRVFEIHSNPELTTRSEAATQVVDPHAWIDESRAIAVQFLYVGEVQQAIRAAIESKSTKLPPVTISEAYGKQAGRIAQVRAVEAAARLAKVLSDSL
jgi:hypothetical protein